MSGRQRTTERDQRRRELGQNFLVDRKLIDRFTAGLEIRPGQLVVDLGAGAGALTIALAHSGAEVWAVERDPAWVRQLTANVTTTGVGGSVRVIEADLRHLRLPRTPFRVVANPPFALTTDLLALLLDRPDRGPTRADLILQREVAWKHASEPPATLRTAAWAPWWTFELGLDIDRHAFRPRPRVDASVLTIKRRSPAILPDWLAPRFRDVLRPAWIT